MRRKSELPRRTGWFCSHGGIYSSRSSLPFWRPLSLDDDNLTIRFTVVSYTFPIAELSHRKSWVGYSECYMEHDWPIQRLSLDAICDKSKLLPSHFRWLRARIASKLPLINWRTFWTGENEEIFLYMKFLPMSDDSENESWQREEEATVSCSFVDKWIPISISMPNLSFHREKQLTSPV